MCIYIYIYIDMLLLSHTIPMRLPAVFRQPLNTHRPTEGVRYGKFSEFQSLFCGLDPGNF